jgi:hypothetical protein
MCQLVGANLKKHQLQSSSKKSQMQLLQGAEVEAEEEEVMEGPLEEEDEANQSSFRYIYFES